MAEVIENPTMPVPVPSINTDTKEFWDATVEGRLTIGRCNTCGEPIWYPRPICPFCHSTDTKMEEVSGRGTVYTFTIVRRGGGQYAAVSPYVLAYVELAEGPRMMTNIVDCAPEQVSVGAAVEVVFHKTPEQAALPRFRLV